MDSRIKREPGGWVICWNGWATYGGCTRELHEALTGIGATFWVELDPLEGAGRDILTAVVERDKHWRVKGSR